MGNKKIIVAITGASGMIYAQKLLDVILKSEGMIQLSLVFSDDGKNVWDLETDKASIPQGLSVYQNNDFYAPFASGSSGYDCMIVCPCTMGTLARIASGTADTLINRAADVLLKERKKLILVTRETPISLIHIKNMETVTLAGGIIFPASPSFYHHPLTIDEASETMAKRILQVAGFDVNLRKWGED